MSASVFKPISLEIPRMRSPLTDRRFVSKGLTRVRRVLFEPVDHMETQKFIEQELAKQSEKESKKWNFDFANEKPMNSGGRYFWSAMISKEKLQAPQKKRALEVEDQTEELYPQFQEQDETCPEISGDLINERVMDHEYCGEENLSPGNPNKKQRLITDFMAFRKHGLIKKAAPRPTPAPSIAAKSNPPAAS